MNHVFACAVMGSHQSTRREKNYDVVVDDCPFGKKIHPIRTGSSVVCELNRPLLSLLLQH